MKTIATWLAAALILAAPFAASAASHADANGIVTIESAHDAPTTIDRLEAAVEGAGATVFARIDHAAGAEKAGMPLRPTILLIFGNPKLGTPALQAAQTMGMDLPLRVVAWEDETGSVFLSYTDPAQMFARHGVEADHPTVAKMSAALEKLTEAAAGT